MKHIGKCQHKVKRMSVRNNLHMKTPIFFKIWFAFVGLIALTIMGGTFYFMFHMIQAGSEGIGRQIGAVVKGYSEGAGGR